MFKYFVIVFISKICYASWVDVETICPSQCFCQYTHLNDLSIARWITNFENSIKDHDVEKRPDFFEDLINNNEAYYSNDVSYLNNPLIKYVMCMFHTDTNVKLMISSLPQDVEALVILHTGTKTNYTVLTSDIVLPDLKILEIRGNDERNLHLVIDVALKSLTYANFESIVISSSESLQRRMNSIDPSENFDYVPFSEKVEYNITHESRDEEIKILPYEVYILELKKSRTMSFYGWNNLEILRIHKCKLDELHWEIFDGLDKLQHLSLEHNEIKIIPPFAFHGVPHIRTLSLARNNILDLNYRALAGLLDLISLDLSYNDLTKLSEISFPPFPKLKVVDLRYNPIKYIFTHAFAVMNSTKILQIGDKDTALLLEGKDTFKFLHNLEHLTISNINVPAFQQSMLQHLKNLEVLKLKGIIKYVEFDAFAEISNVKELILNNCQIEELSMDAFFGISDIEIIDLSHNKLNYLPPGLFDDKRYLKEIYLQNNQLSELPKNFFNNLNIKLLSLTENPWICTCDMMNWKQGITNKVRTSKVTPKCLYDQLKSFKSCKLTHSNKRDYNYVFDNKLTPRCDGGPDNVKNRSIYYALRRNLKCTPSIPMRSVQEIENEQKLRLKNKQLREEEEIQHKAKVHRDRFNRKNFIVDKKTYQHQKVLNKYERTMNQQNDLYLQLANKRPSYDYDKIDNENTFKNSII